MLIVKNFFWTLLQEVLLYRSFQRLCEKMAQRYLSIFSHHPEKSVWSYFWGCSISHGFHTQIDVFCPHQTPHFPRLVESAEGEAGLGGWGLVGQEHCWSIPAAAKPSTDPLRGPVGRSTPPHLPGGAVNHPAHHAWGGFMANPGAQCKELVTGIVPGPGGF